MKNGDIYTVSCTINTENLTKMKNVCDSVMSSVTIDE